MRRTLLFLLAVTMVLGANAQYYYSDILGTKQTNQTYKQIRASQYKKISATSFEGHEPVKDFVLEQTIAPDGTTIVTRSASIGNTESLFTGYYQNNRIVRTVDSSAHAINTVLYDYDKTGRVTSVNSTSKDFDGTFTSTENHLWSYNDKGQPEKMFKIKNNVDTTVVTLVYDEEENVAEERWTKNNRAIETYFYYYNPKKQLTDIVRYNRKAKRMLPDFIFDYDDKGNIVQMTQMQGGIANYLIWRYTYNENGLKTKEVAFNKNKEALGRIEYIYQ